MLDKADVVVVGAGIVGTTAAFFLSQRADLRVIVVERDRPAYGASGRSGGGVRQQRRSPPELPLVQESVRLWQYFRDVEGAPIEYQQKGNLQVAMTPADAEVLKKQAGAETQAGLAVEFLTAEDVRKIEPLISPEVCGANYCATDGDANPILATRYFARHAQQNGVIFHLNTEVLEFVTDHGRITGVRTSRGLVEAGAVVVAVGPWTPKLLQTIGVQVPIIARRTQALVTVPVPPLVRTFVGGNTVYVRQTASGTLLWGGGGDWEQVGFDTASSQNFFKRVARRGSQLMPALKNFPVMRAWSGIADMTPDHTAIIGPVRRWPGLLIAAGFNGHGFAIGLAVGRVLADLVIAGQSSVPTEALSLERFPEGFDYLAHYQSIPEPI